MTTNGNRLDRVAKKALESNLKLYSIAQADENGVTEIRLHPADACTNSYSVAKAFIMTAIGLLYDENKISPEDKVLRYLSSQCPLSARAAWREVTVEHLLTHKVGFDRGFLDIDVENRNEYPTDDFLSLVFSEPLVHTPGTHFQYTDAAYYMLSVILTEITGKRADDFLRPLLFEQLEFEEAAFSICPRGYAIGATGLFLRTRDMVKLGLLYACNGIYRQKRVLSSEWIATALARGYEFSPVGHTSWYAKGGMYGQMLCFSQRHGAALAWHGYETNDVGCLLTALDSEQ